MEKDEESKDEINEVRNIFGSKIINKKFHNFPFLFLAKSDDSTLLSIQRMEMLLFPFLFVYRFFVQK